MAARHDHCPWHLYRALSPHDKAQVIANLMEHNLREAITARRVKAKSAKDARSSTIGVEEFL